MFLVSAAPSRWNLVCLPQQGLGLGGLAEGDSAAAEAGKRVGLVMGAAGQAGEVQCLLVTFSSADEVTTNPVQRPLPVERLGLTLLVAEGAVDAQGLLQRLGRARVITRHLPHGPEALDGVGLAARLPRPR